MLKIILIVILLVGIFVGVFFYFNTSQKFENPIGKTLEDILGSSEKSPPNPNKIINSAKDSFDKNVDDAKDTAYSKAKTTLDNVFNKQSDPANTTNDVVVNVLGVTNSNPSKTTYDIDLSSESDLKLNLSLNTKYYLKFKNIPNNYCLYINGNKYPITDGVLEIQFGKAGNYPIKANNCNLNDKSIGSVVVE